MEISLKTANLSQFKPPLAWGFETWFFVGVSAAAIAIAVLLWYKQKKRNRPLALEYQENHSLQDDDRFNRDSQQRPTLRAKPKLTATLRELLISGRWEEADKETKKIMLKVANRLEEGWLDVASIQNFPVQELDAIDQLWIESSNGHFGFSVQRDIWQSVGGSLDVSDKIYEAFGDRVGWRVHEKWLQVKDLNFDTSSKMGHLPGLAVSCLFSIASSSSASCSNFSSSKTSSNEGFGVFAIASYFSSISSNFCNAGAFSG